MDANSRALILIFGILTVVSFVWGGRSFASVARSGRGDDRVLESGRGTHAHMRA